MRFSLLEVKFVAILVLSGFSLCVYVASFLISRFFFFFFLISRFFKNLCSLLLKVQGWQVVSKDTPANSGGWRVLSKNLEQL